MYTDLRDFHKTYFSSVPILETASETLFKDILKGSNATLRQWLEGMARRSNTGRCSATLVTLKQVILGQSCRQRQPVRHEPQCSVHSCLLWLRRCSEMASL
jgi:hypothetical protein